MATRTASTNRRRNLFLTFGEQAFSSIGSVAVLIAAAQGLGLEEFAKFSFAIATILVVQSFCRAFAGEVLLTSHTVKEVEQDRGSKVIGALLISGGVVAPIASFVAYVIYQDGVLAIASAGLALVVLVQDGYRLYCIRHGNSLPLFTFTIGTNVSQAAAVLGLALLTSTASWAVLGGAGAIFVWELLYSSTGRMSLSLRSGWRWIQEYRSVGGAFLVEVASGALISYGLSVYLAASEGPEAIAGFRSTLAVYGFTSVLINFARASLQHDLSNVVYAQGRPKLVRYSAQIAVLFLSGVGATYLVLTLSLPRLGEALLGPTAYLVLPLLLIAAVDRLLACISTIPTILLRAAGVTWRATVVRVSLALLWLGLSPLFVTRFQAAGAFLVEVLFFLSVTVSLTFVVRRVTTRSKESKQCL